MQPWGGCGSLPLDQHKHFSNPKKWWICRPWDVRTGGLEINYEDEYLKRVLKKKKKERGKTIICVLNDLNLDQMRCITEHLIFCYFGQCCVYTWFTRLMRIMWKQNRMNIDYVHCLLGEAFYLMDMQLYFIQTFIREQIFTKLSNILMFQFLWGLKVKIYFFVYLVPSLKRSLHPCHQHWEVFISTRPYFLFF